MKTQSTIRIVFGSLLVLSLAIPLWSSTDDSQTADKRNEQQAAVPGLAATDIQLSFKRDSRVVDPYRGIGPWVMASSFAGATAQDTIEIRAQGVNAAGRPTKINPQWTASDPQMVTVSPAQGDDVKITVHNAGESKLEIADRGLSKQLMVTAKYVGKFILVEISSQTKDVKPNPVATADPPPLQSQKQRVSYAAGMNLAKVLQKHSVEVDADLLAQGYKEAVAGGKTLMSEEQAQAILAAVQADQKISEAAMERKAIAQKNKEDGQAFLAENAKKEGVVTLPSGLQYKIVKAGNGKRPTADDVVVCKYRGSLINGKQFERGGPVTFPLKAVIKGWSEALQLMPAGSTWQIFIPTELAYGERPPRRSSIGPNSALVFEVELISIQEPAGNKTETARQEIQPAKILPEGRHGRGRY
jgi:FKBP-type peptidyl-prolyl cis-trans isomerase FklB